MKKGKVILSAIIIILLIICIYFFINNSSKKDVIIASTDDCVEELINITECSEEFMTEYFENSKEMNEKGNPENILIVTSKNSIGDGFGASKIVEAPNNQYFLQYDSEEEKNKALSKIKNVDNDILVEENVIRQVEDYNSWGIEKTGLNQAIDVANGKNLSEVTVAVMDTGCDMDLFNQYYPDKIEETYNVLNPGSDMVDEHGHGTHVAGTVAEGTPDNVKILPVKISSDGYMTSVDIINAINYIVYNNKADVINMSFGGYSYTTAENTAIEAAKDANIICVAAAGNKNTSSSHYPSGYDGAMSIAAVDSNLNKSTFSNYGNDIDFTAPGTNILSINGTESGTSMAAPHVSSAVAILKSYNKNYTFDDVIEILKAYAIDLGDIGYDKYFGNGLINFSGIEYCTCGCDLCDSIYCKDCECSECIFEDKEEINVISKIEANVAIRAPYNYGSITNILDSIIKIYYGDNVYITKTLLDLDGVEIIGYDPYCYTNQTITVKYAGFETIYELDVGGEAYEYGWEYELLDENNIRLTKLKTYTPGTVLKKIYVPQTIDGYTVTSIGESLLTYYSIEYINLPETVTEICTKGCAAKYLKKIDIQAEKIKIGDQAFYEAKCLETVNATISALGSEAFYGCIKLNNITLDDSLEMISSGAFWACSNLENINIPSSLTSIGETAFSGTNLKSIVIPNGVTKLEKNTFYDCSNLESVTISENVTEIADYAFAYSGNLKSIHIPKNVSIIGEKAFYLCNGLETITVDEENQVFDSRDNCNAIIETAINKLILGASNTVIPNTVKIIGKSAFEERLKLIEMIIPESVEEIQARAFYGCTYLETVFIPNSVTTIGGAAFLVLSDNSVIWVYKDSYAKTYLEENSLNYKCIDPSTIKGYVNKKEYVAFENVETDGMYIRLWYDDGRWEDIKENIVITYINGNDSFRAEDIYFTMSAYTELGIYVECQVSVTVSKVIPEYVVPTDITAIEGQTLSEVTLPEGFEWMDETESIESSGNIIFKAKYTPDDIENYEIVENIEITVLVEANRGTYIVEHYKENLDGTYTLIDTNSYSAIVGREMTLPILEYTGFTSPNVITVTIEKGEKIHKYEYTRNSYIVNIEASEGIKEVIGNGTYKYEEEVNLEVVYEDDYENATWSGDYTTNTFTMPAQDVNMTVSATKIVKKGTCIVEHYTENLDGTYTLVYRNSYSDIVGNIMTLPTSEFVGFTTPEARLFKFEEGEQTYKYYYTRNSYTVNVEMGEGIKEVIGNGTYKYEEEVDLEVVYEDDYENATWSGDYTTNTFTMPAQDVNMTVNATKIEPVVPVTPPSVSYRSHVQNIGWENSWKYNGQLSGTVGKCWRLEGLQVCLHDAPYEGTVTYRSHVQTVGWESTWRTHSQVSGSVGKSLRVEAIQIKLTDEMAEHYDIYYRLQIQDYGWLGWAKNGQSAGSEGHSKKVEAIEIKLVEKGGQAPGSTDRRFVRASGLKYRSHVQNIGWMPYVDEKGLAGTSGKGLRVEAFQLLLTTTQYDGGIRYRANIQNQGWEDWKYDKQESGTSGKSLRMEAFQIQLYGDVANYYDVYYRVHVQNIGWMGWAKNGESVGTEGYGYRIESFQIQLVDKGEAAPGSTEDCFRSK